MDTMMLVLAFCSSLSTIPVVYVELTDRTKPTTRITITSSYTGMFYGGGPVKLTYGQQLVIHGCVADALEVSN